MRALRKLYVGRFVAGGGSGGAATVAAVTAGAGASAGGAGAVAAGVATAAGASIICTTRYTKAIQCHNTHQFRSCLRREQERILPPDIR